MLISRKARTARVLINGYDWLLIDNAKALKIIIKQASCGGVTKKNSLNFELSLIFAAFKA